jgi:hypothetical protein
MGNIWPYLFKSLLTEACADAGHRRATRYLATLSLLTCLAAAAEQMSRVV